MRFFRYCEKCKEKFEPTKKYQHLCLSCFKKVQKENLDKLFEARGSKWNSNKFEAGGYKNDKWELENKRLLQAWY